MTPWYFYLLKARGPAEKNSRVEWFKRGAGALHCLGKDIVMVDVAMRVGVVCAAALITATAGAGARPDDTSRDWFGFVNLGWVVPQGDTSDVLDDDWTLSGGAMYWPSDWPVGLVLEAAYSDLDVSNKALDAINDAIASDPGNSGRVDGGDLETWQFTANVVWSPGSGNNGFFLTGGVGAYSLHGVLTETGLVYYPPFCDPWYWWWCFPGGVGTGNIVRGSESSTELGWNVGLGYAFPTSTGQIFIEAKYHEISTDGPGVSYLPITVGFRF